MQILTQYTSKYQSKTLIDSCDASFIGIQQPQNISTPEYPHQYRSNLTCAWTISTSGSYRIKLETGYVSNDTCCEKLKVTSFHKVIVYKSLCKSEKKPRHKSLHYLASPYVLDCNQNFSKFHTKLNFIQNFLIFVNISGRLYWINTISQAISFAQLIT